MTRTALFRIVLILTVLTAAGFSVAFADHQCGHASALTCSVAATGTLSSADCPAGDNSFYDEWEFAGTAGQTVTIDMGSTAFDTYLALLNPNDVPVAENDDVSAGDTDSRITFTLNVTGAWTVIANSLEPNRFGNYTLNISCTGDVSSTIYIPISGSAGGALGTRFITDLRIVNPAATTADVTMEYIPLNPAGAAGPSTTATITVAPGEQAVLNDVVTNQFSTTGLGAIRIRATQPVEVVARIINDQRPINEGTAGFAFKGKTLSDAKVRGTLPFLSSASSADQGAGLGFRTNLGYFNPGTTEVTAAFTARRTTDGSVLGTNTVPIPSLASRLSPIFDIIASVPAESRVQTDYYVTWESSGPVYVYASITDNKTGDGVFVE